MSVVIARADARELPLRDGTVDLVVTSPPYYGLREYRDVGGVVVAGQVGLEPDPLDYLDALLEVTAECFRVLRPGGSMWVNLGDKRADRAGGRDNRRQAVGGVNVDGRTQRPSRANTTRLAPRGSRLMLPERFALACIDKLGLSVRQTVVWDKPSALPESVRDRCRDSHEWLLHLVRPGRYYSAVDRIREPHAASSVTRSAPWRAASGALHGDHPDGTGHRVPATSLTHPAGALPGSVWRIPTVPLVVPQWLVDELGGVDHHAAFPPELARRCVLGWSPQRRCLACGAGLRPVVVADPYGAYAGGQDAERTGAGRRDNSAERSRIWRARVRAGLGTRVLGEECDCPDGPGATVPGVVVDPFGGTGTTALVADVHGRDGVSLDLSHGYGRIAAWRTADDRERARAADRPMPPRVPDGQAALFDAGDP